MSPGEGVPVIEQKPKKAQIFQMSEHSLFIEEHLSNKM
jgi:hypothetical protein